MAVGDQRRLQAIEQRAGRVRSVANAARVLDLDIIAIGDLHADLPAAQRAFHLAGVTDAEGRWAARGVTVVQTGDLTDRGPDGAPLLRWIRGLEPQA